MKPRFKRTVLQTVRKYSGVITLDDLRKKFNIPVNAEVRVRVPGGGDWSNQDLDVTEIFVMWEELR